MIAEESISIKKNLADVFDWNTFLIAISLIAVGLISIYSATFDAGMDDYFFKQLMFAGIGTVVMIGLVFVPERWIGMASYVAYGGSLLLLVAVIVVGHEVYGSKSWLIIGPISLQPSELAKVGTLLALARYISRPNVDLRTLRDLGLALLHIAVPVALIMQEPDFGSATVFAVMIMGIALWCGADLLLMYALITPPIIALISFFGEVPMYIAIGIAALGAIGFRRGIVLTAVVILINVAAGFSTNAMYKVMKPHQKSRIEVFLDPNKDPKGRGYHVIQSKMAVGSGGILGKGFLQGTQTQLRYIPKQWTDFIYCVPTEEFGFIGGTMVLGLLLGLSWRAIRIAEMVRTKFASTIAAGIATIWAYHTLVNIGMAIGVMPVMGIPLPFLSAGGSSLVVNMAMVGLLLNFYRHRRERFD